MAFHTIARMPAAYRFLQKRVTGRYFLEVTDHVFRVHSFHVRHFKGGRALEFGAGTNLLCPLMLSHAGASEVIACDLQRIASVDRINHVIRQLRIRLGGPWPEVKTFADLERFYRIRYLAPFDMRATALPSGSVDFICSTSTLEHIPKKAIGDILRECRRISTGNAVMSFVIDYHDHYATADAAISRFNFYRYPDWQWRLFNPGLHFQNRLRHSDYVRLFSDFVPIEIRGVRPHPVYREPPRIAHRFAGYSAEDRALLNGYFAFHVPSPKTVTVMREASTFAPAKAPPRRTVKLADPSPNP